MENSFYSIRLCWLLGEGATISTVQITLFWLIKESEVTTDYNLLVPLTTLQVA